MNDEHLTYDAVPFDVYNNGEQWMEWGQYVDPYIYADPLGGGGATELRYAQTAAASPALPGDAYWRRQLGQVPTEPPELTTDGVCPAGTTFDFLSLKCQPGDIAPTLPPGTDIPTGVPPLPGLPPGTTPPAGLPVTEQQCQAREDTAFQNGVAQ